MSIMKSKTVQKAVLSVEQDEGVGARVRRSVGRPEVRMYLYLHVFLTENPEV